MSTLCIQLNEEGYINYRDFFYSHTLQYETNECDGSSCISEK